MCNVSYYIILYHSYLKYSHDFLAETSGGDSGGDKWWRQWRRQVVETVAVKRKIVDSNPNQSEVFNVLISTKILCKCVKHVY